MVNQTYHFLSWNYLSDSSPVPANLLKWATGEPNGGTGKLNQF